MLNFVETVEVVKENNNKDVGKICRTARTEYYVTVRIATENAE